MVVGVADELVDYAGSLCAKLAFDRIFLVGGGGGEGVEQYLGELLMQ